MSKAELLGPMKIRDRIGLRVIIIGAYIMAEPRREWFKQACFQARRKFDHDLGVKLGTVPVRSPRSEE